MIAQFIEWTTHHSSTNNAAFAFITVGTMAIVGVGLALLVEIIFAVIGIKTGKIEKNSYIKRE